MDFPRYITSLLVVGALLSCAGQSGEQAPAAPTLPCNGSPILCNRAYDQVAYATSHNAFSNAAEGWLAPNQEESITVQLEREIRGLMLDTHYNADQQPSLCHGDCIWGERPLRDGLEEIRIFLDNHPHEVVTIIFEAYISAADTASAMDQAQLSPYLYTQPAGEPWPTLQELIDRDQRLVVFTDAPEEAFDACHDVWAFCWETHWAAEAPMDLDCTPNRGSTDNSLFILNHFLTAPIALPSLAEQVNHNPFLLQRAQLCQKKQSALPNFVTVDFAATGSVLETVDVLNGVSR